MNSEVKFSAAALKLCGNLIQKGILTKSCNDPKTVELILNSYIEYLMDYAYHDFNLEAKYVVISDLCERVYKVKYNDTKMMIKHLKWAFKPMTRKTDTHIIINKFWDEYQPCLSLNNQVFKVSLSNIFEKGL